jgi:KaiC/GvpD/RAD55 family RecA-like ATPase
MDGSFGHINKKRREDPGLDSLIEGGIPNGFTVMVVGNAGTGKTTLCSQYYYAHEPLMA